MRTTIKALLLSSMLLCSANADFLMTLTDKDGVEDNICVKSYSFSNTLESLHKQENQTIDEYSTTKEVLTNKRFDGKPVYRKIFTFDEFIVPISAKGIDKYTPVISEDIDDIIELSYRGYRKLNHDDYNGEIYFISENNSYYVTYTDGTQYMFAAAYRKDLKKAYVSLRQNRPNHPTWTISGLKIFVEYTKTTDTAQSSTSSLTTMVHYLPSNSSTGEYITKSLDETGIRFLKNYRYDENTSSCVKN